MFPHSQYPSPPGRTLEGRYGEHTYDTSSKSVTEETRSAPSWPVSSNSPVSGTNATSNGRPSGGAPLPRAARRLAPRSRAAVRSAAGRSVLTPRSKNSSTRSLSLCFIERRAATPAGKTWYEVVV